MGLATGKEQMGATLRSRRLFAGNLMTGSLMRTASVVVGLLLWLALGAPPAGAQPDLTGVWAPVTGAAPPGSAGAPLPFTEDAQRKVAAYQALVRPAGETPGGYCLGAGMPGSMLGAAGYPMEIIQRPDQITIIYELHSEVRRIYFGPRAIPEPDRIPGRNGHSIGRWMGDVLVVETTHLVEQVDQRYAHSADARIVERYQLTRTGDETPVLHVEMTLIDPAFYTELVTAERRWTRVPNGHLLPYDCNEEVWQRRLEQLAEPADRR
jgi:hypothetical protein